ncbi:hypothetical protein MRX96_006881 [Rhipicephalus microplus]
MVSVAAEITRREERPLGARLCVVSLVGHAAGQLSAHVVPEDGCSQKAHWRNTRIARFLGFAGGPSCFSSREKLLWLLEATLVLAVGDCLSATTSFRACGVSLP